MTPPLFRDVTESVGLPNAMPRWPDGRYAIPELYTGGVALFDADADGDLDLYHVRAPSPDRPQAAAPNRLYLRDGDRYVAAPRANGLDDDGYGFGVATGDIDDDGDVDVFIANLGVDRLYENRGDGSFTPRTGFGEIAGSAWSSSAAFFDYDRDGDLDLYVTRYVVPDPRPVCRVSLDEPPDYCGPEKFVDLVDRLYRNDGADGFIDVSAAAGITRAAPGLGVVCVDLTGDGWVDIYVANDMKPNQLYVNRGDDTFADEAFERGVAVNGGSQAEAGMGVAIGDINRDGHFDLLVTHRFDQTNTLYRSDLDEGAVRFDDVSATSGVGAKSLPYTAWGCGFFDFDHDGDLDLVAVNGRVARGTVHAEADEGSFWNAYAEPDQLFLQANGRFLHSPERGGAFTRGAEVSRTLAFGDLDADGDLDLVTTSIGDRLRVFSTDAPSGSHWLRVRARVGARDALGASVSIEHDGTRQTRPIVTAHSFQSASEPIAHFGLGDATRVERLIVVWPDGSREEFTAAGIDRTITVAQGSGRRI